ncbi:MAG: MFS transporter [Candidatus Nanopelagicales bacterium]
MATTTEAVTSTIPARLDRLKWSPFHRKMIMALGVAWILDGLEITIAGSIAGVLGEPGTLNMSSTEIGLVATTYLVGQVIGALFFGKLSDRLGRRKLFMITLGVYLFGSGLSAFTMGQGTGWVIFLYATRVIAGMGIGGEYAAINSAIDEMMPSKYRGRVDIGINGTYWAGSIIGTVASLILLNTLPEDLGWRIGFLLGPILGIVIMLVRRHLPESPRWQLTHGYAEEAEESMQYIEGECRKAGQEVKDVPMSKAITVKPEKSYGYIELLKVLFKMYPKRTVLGASLMITQSFLYNAIFFTYTLVLVKFFGVDPNMAPVFLICFAVGNLAGPLLLGHLFDTIGRKVMISSTYIGSGILLAISAWLFNIDALNAVTQTICWCVIFFFASAGASSAYLTVSEIFPIEVRAQAIAVFFAIAQCFGALGPVFYGWLIGDGTDRTSLFIGYLIGAGIMVAGGVIEILFGVNAEGKSLENVAKPLTAVDDIPDDLSGDGDVAVATIKTKSAKKVEKIQAKVADEEVVAERGKKATQTAAERSKQHAEEKAEAAKAKARAKAEKKLKKAQAKEAEEIKKLKDLDGEV